MHFDSPNNGNVSTTLFLSEPDEYEGGELELYLDGGVKCFKLEAGKAILYNTQIPHRVRKVTKGKRIASVTWLRSMIPDKNVRKQLWRLHCLQDTLSSRYEDFDDEKNGWNAETLRESTNHPQFQLKAIIAELVAQNLIIPEQVRFNRFNHHKLIYQPISLNYFYLKYSNLNNNQKTFLAFYGKLNHEVCLLLLFLIRKLRR